LLESVLILHELIVDQEVRVADALTRREGGRDGGRGRKGRRKREGEGDSLAVQRSATLLWDDYYARYLAMCTITLTLPASTQAMPLRNPKKLSPSAIPPPVCLPFSCPPYHDALGEGENLLTVHLGHGLFEIRHEGVPLALRAGGREGGRTGGREAAG